MSEVAPGSASGSGSVVTNNTAESRYEITRDGRLAGFAVYQERGSRIVFIHTEIAEEFGGKGLGSVLAKHAIEDANARGLTIVPVCPFIAAWLRKHPEYEEHVDWHAADAPTADVQRASPNEG